MYVLEYVHVYELSKMYVQRVLAEHNKTPTFVLNYCNSTLYWCWYEYAITVSPAYIRSACMKVAGVYTAGLALHYSLVRLSTTILELYVIVCVQFCEEYCGNQVNPR